MTIDCIALRNWFLTEQRDLPWRNLRTPYAVWVSEMMLQQTQVNVVIPYFERWMTAFPTITALAEASLEEVLKLWEGLGYYSRARYLHAGARLIVDQHGGELPKDYQALKELKGVGEYTAGAILSFAFGQKTTAVDGNVIRVLSRYFLIEDDVSKPHTLQKIRSHALELLPDEEPWVINEALIELGATVCMRTPHCNQCPIRSGCRAHQQGKSQTLPYKPPRAATTFLLRGVAVICHRNHLLLRKDSEGIMADLYEFPYLEMSGEEEKSDLQKKFELTLEIPLQFETHLEAVSHTFTRYRARLCPTLFSSSHSLLPEVKKPYRWVSVEDVVKCTFSSGHRRVWHLALPIAKNKDLLIDTNLDAP